MAALARPSPRLTMPQTVLPRRERDPRVSETANTAMYLELLNDYIAESIASLRIGQIKALDVDFLDLDAQLDQLLGVKEGWDSYNAPAPDPDTIAEAREILDRLRAEVVRPQRISASAEGGVAVSFRAPGNRRAQIEILNNGERFAHLYDLNGSSYTLEWPDDYKNEPFEALIEPILRFMQS